MSRRAPNPAAERAAQNQQTIKTLLKLEGNKICGDCKRNKHPRWASWNIGVFVCIRCSGIHRGMGTHISRVKSVDLDAWTDEQLQSVLRWGNLRANKYWEAKLAPGHIPSEAKIENFIRTKYESKRWTMEGPMPDPATLDEDGDDDVPLNVVQEKAKLERSSSQQKPSSSIPQNTDIFGEIQSPPPRPNTTGVSAVRPAPPPSKFSVPPKQPKPADSLLGLDFFGGLSSAPTGSPSAISSAPSTSAASSRPDLKQSILSLYASAPRPQPHPQHERQSSFGGMQSSQAQPAPVKQKSSLDDAFSGLTFTAPPLTKPLQQQPNAFTASEKPAYQRSSTAAPQLTSPSISSGGSFFDISPERVPKSKPPAQNPLAQKANALSLGFDDLDFKPKNLDLTNPPKATALSATLAGSKINTLFSFSDPEPAKTPAPKPKHSAPSSDISSAFNLSVKPAPSQAAPKPAPPATSAFSGFATADAWGSNDAWATPDPPSTTAAPPAEAKITKYPSIPTTNGDLVWGVSTSSTSGFGQSGGGGGFFQAAPRVAADEDFGGWNSAAVSAAPASTPAPARMTAAKPTVPSGSKPAVGSFAASEDLFSNVWE